MLLSFFIITKILSVFGDEMNFYPKDPANLFISETYHKERVWVRLDDDCVSEEDDVRGFKDYLLTQYECISFDEEKRETIYKTPITSHSHAWSLWFEKDEDFMDVECLNNIINLPSNIASSCIDNVYYEPTVPPDDTSNLDDDGCDYQCKKQSVDDKLWSLDILDSKDGSYDNIHTYVLPENDKHDDGGGDDECYVEAILIDTPVDASHPEFDNSDPKPLYGTTEQLKPAEHGTHVAGIMVGITVGGSKNTPLRYAPMYSWAWSVYEKAFNTVISYMEDQRKQKGENIRFVINYSIYLKYNLQYEEWGKKIQAAGGIWVNSAGNAGMNLCDIRDNPYSLTIGAYDKELKATWWSNYGPCVNAWGPGLNVYSAKPGGGYQLMSGTSMASPNIASMVINLLKMNIKMTFDDIQQYMKDNARYVDDEKVGKMNQPYLVCDDNGDNGDNGGNGENISVEQQPMVNNDGTNVSMTKNSDDNMDDIIIICCIVTVILLVIGILFWYCFRKRLISYKKSSTTTNLEQINDEDPDGMDTNTNTNELL